MPDAGETQITSGRNDRLPVSARLLVVSFVLLVAGIARVIESDGKDGATASAAVAAIDGALTETSAALEAYFSQTRENA